MYNNATYTNNTHKKMYQNNYTNIPEQYINIIRNGPDENTVIRGYHVNGANSGHLEIWIKPKIIININTKKPEKISLIEDGNVIVSTEITETFGKKWIPTFQKLFPGWLK